MDINHICEEIVYDITNKTAIAEILLKAQVLSSMVELEEFRQWVSNEQNGYADPLKVPYYRILGCNVTALLTIPFHIGQTEMNVPVDAISHKGAREMLSKVYYESAAVEAERLAAAPTEEHLRKPTPAMGYRFVQELFPNAHVDAVFQDLSPHSFATLIDNVKSRMLSFILGMNKEGVIQLRMSAPDKKEVVSKIYYQTFNNSMVNNEGGSISAVNNLLLNQDSISEEDLQRLQMMFTHLNVLVKGEEDPMLQDAVETLNNEIYKPKPKKSVIKKTLALIKGLAMGVASGEIATIINAALGLL